MKKALDQLNVSVAEKKLNGLAVQALTLGLQMKDIFDFYFEKNDGNPVSNSPRFNITFASLMPNPTLNIIPGGQSIYVNLTAIGINLALSGDELKLVWSNLGGIGAPFNGNDVVVDRVEYGNQDMEPDNTTMPDATAPAPGWELYRLIPGQDTNDCSVDFGTQAETAWPTTIPEQVVVTATHDDISYPNDIKLNWTTIPTAYGYLIYRDDPFTPIDVNLGLTNTQYVDLGRYLDSANYIYGVTSWGPGGENRTWEHNIAFKQIVTLNDYFTIPGIKAGNYNYLSLPYYMNLTSGNNANGLLNDINTYGNPLSSATSVGRWDPVGSGGWDTTSNFPLVRGEAYQVIVSDNVDYKVVGAHRNVSINLPWTNSVNGGVLNFISLPYHFIGTAYTDANDLLWFLKSFASGPDQVTRVARWDGSTGQWQSKTEIGKNFLLTPGEGYLVAAKEAFSFGP